MSPEPRREDLRRTRRAVEAIEAGASAREIARTLRVRTATAERLKRALIGTNNPTKGETMDSTEYTEAAFTGVDLSDERLLYAELGGEPVILTPMPDGSIHLARRGDRPRLDVLNFAGGPAELSAEINGERLVLIPRADGSIDVGSTDLAASFGGEGGGPVIVDLTEPTNECSPEKGSEVTRVEDERLYEDWLAFRAGDPLEEDSGDGADLSDDGTDAGADLAAGEAVYREWLGQKAAQGVDLAVAVGDAVEWGEGAGKGHGVVMELDTSEGWVNVHTCEVIEGTGGRGPALSPTGRTIKMNGAKLRPSPLPIVGESPVGPELSADLAGSDSSGTADLTEEELIAVLDRDLTRMHGGYDGAE